MCGTPMPGHFGLIEALLDYFEWNNGQSLSRGIVFQTYLEEGIKLQWTVQTVCL